jgi:hypothetical protein
MFTSSGLVKILLSLLLRVHRNSMVHNFSNAKPDFSEAIVAPSTLNTPRTSPRFETSVPAPLMWWFMATAVAVFLMVFSRRLVGDAAGYCLLTVIIIGMMLFRSGNTDDDEG